MQTIARPPLNGRGRSSQKPVLTWTSIPPSGSANALHSIRAGRFCAGVLRAILAAFRALTNRLKTRAPMNREAFWPARFALLRSLWNSRREAFESHSQTFEGVSGLRLAASPSNRRKRVLRSYMLRNCAISSKNAFDFPSVSAPARTAAKDLRAASRSDCRPRKRTTPVQKPASEHQKNVEERRPPA